MTDDTTGTETARETCGATTESGTPCQKGADHGGGHWFMSDDQYACLRAEHYDPLAVLSLQPLVHLDVPCPRNAPTAPTEARGLGERVAALADRMAPAVSGTPLDCKNTLLAEAAAPETEGQR